MFWGFWITALFWVVDLQYSQQDGSLVRYFLLYGLSWTCHAVFFYTLYFYLIPKLAFTGKYIQFCIFFLLGSFLNVYAHSTLWNDLQTKYLFELRDDQLLNLLGWQVVILFYSGALRFWEEWTNSEEGKIALKNEVKSSELNYLKSQMSPHFLFNTLNNIYSLSLSGEKTTTEAIKQLKNMMGYVHHFESGEKVNLKTEVQYLKDYVALNQLRYQVPVRFEVTVTDQNREIEPMLFLPFIENAFKHGDMTVKGFVHLTLSDQKGKLKFIVQNKVGFEKRKDEVSGVGINNVKKRIQLIYPFSNQFDVQEKDNLFTVKLELT